MHLFSLRFRRDELERAYVSHHAKSLQWLDRLSMVTSATQLALGIASWVWITGGVPPPNSGGCVPLMCGSMLVHSLQAFMLLRRKDWYLVHRTLAVASLAALTRAVTAAFVPFCRADSSYTARFAYQSALIPLAWYTATMPLLLPAQAGMQVLSVAAYLATTVGPVCATLTAAQDDAGLITRVWALLDTANRQALLMWGVPPPQRAGGANPIGAEASRTSYTQCVHTLSYLHVLLGAWLPLGIVYCLEARSRARFAHSPQGAALLAAGQQVGAARAPADAPAAPAAVGSFSASPGAAPLAEALAAAEAPAAGAGRGGAGDSATGPLPGTAVAALVLSAAALSWHLMQAVW